MRCSSVSKDINPPARAKPCESEIDGSAIVHVNAHATSTPQGDIAEGLMLHATLGEHVSGVVVTSTKSMTGHLLGGAGARAFIQGKQAVDILGSHLRERLVDFRETSSLHPHQLDVQGSRGVVQHLGIVLPTRIERVEEHAHARNLGRRLLQKLKAFLVAL